MAGTYDHEWRRLRRAWVDRLSMSGPVTCRKCGRPVHAQARLNWDRQPFDLGHGRAAINGGDGGDAMPEHRTCNRSDGGRIGNARRYAVKASRDW